MKTTLATLLTCILVALCWAKTFGAPVPYAGKVAINGLNFSGNAAFTFALRDGNGTVHWRNGADANATINVSVDRGHYLVLLGGQGMTPIPPSLSLDHPELYLQVHFFRPDSGQWLHLLPDQRINSAPHALSAEVAKLADLATLADAVKPGAITRAMLAAEVLADLNATVHLPEQNATIAPGSVTLSHLTPGIRADLNGTINRSRLSQDVLADLNRTIVITRNMLPASVLADLNGTISRSRLSADVLADLNATISRSRLAGDILADLNRTFSISPGSITANLLAPGLLDQNITLAAGSVTKAMLAADVLADLNATQRQSDGNASGPLVLPVAPGQAIPEGYNRIMTGKGAWSVGTPLPEPRIHFGATGLAGKLYVFGGKVKNIQNMLELTATARIFDPVSDQWGSLPSMPVAAVCGAVSVNDKILVLLSPSGSPPSGNSMSLKSFDPSTGQWGDLSSLPALLTNTTGGATGTYLPPALSLHQGKVYVAGKGSGATSGNTKVYAYDPIANNWSEKTAIPVSMSPISVGTCSGKLFAVGTYTSGAAGSSPCLYRMEDNGSWLAMNPPSEEASNFSFLPDRILALASEESSGATTTRTNEVEIYDVSSNSWLAGSSLLSVRESFHSAVLEDTVYLMGGSQQNGASVTYLETVEKAPLSSFTDLYFRDGNASSGGSGGTTTIAAGSVTKAMLAAEVLADLNATSGSDGNGSSTAAVPAGNLVAVPASDSAPAGYSLHQSGQRKNLVWEEKAPVSVARSADDGVEVLDGKIYSVGGWSSSSFNTTERYDPATNQWETLNPMSVARKGVAAAVLNGKLYAIGGDGLSSVEIFDPQTGQWAAGPALPSEVKFGTAITVGGKILLVGGRDANNVKLNQVLEFDPATNQWNQKAPMPTARLSMRLVIFEGKVWAIGGNDGSHTNKVEIYDITSNTWTTGPPLTTIRHAPTVWVANGRIYVAGGLAPGGIYHAAIEFYDSVTNQWAAAGSLPENKYYASAAVLSGKVYVVAGQRASNTLSNKVYAANLNASVAGVFDLYRRDGNASSGGSGGTAAIAPNSITTSQLSETILKYLKPEITAQPQAQPVNSDSNVTFSVSAEGKYLSYQWKKNGVDLVGETNATLTITDANATLHDGNYTVTVSNDFGGVESSALEIAVSDSLLQGLVGWWKFDETNGTVANDSSGKGNNGTLLGNPTWVSGKIGGALSLDGGDYMEVSSRKWNLENVASVSLWFNLSQNTSGNETVFSLGQPSANDEILFWYDGQSMRFFLHKSGGNWARLSSSASVSTWRHFSGVIDGGFAQSQMKFYSNGQLLNAAYDIGGSPALLSDSHDRKLRIGERVSGSADFHGLIDDVRIYDRALSAAEVQALYQSGQ